VNALPPPTVTRRVALAAVAGSFAGAAACSPNASNAPARRRAGASRPAEPQVDPDVLLAATVLADEQRLLDLVDATLARYPGLTDVLTVAGAAHAAHVELLEEAAPDEPLPSASPTEPVEPADPSATSSSDPGAGAEPDVPRDRRRALLELARSEDDLALVDKRSAFAAESGAFARVLASMAASAAQQATLLREVAEGRA
jgi:hypothetical protein